VLLAALAAFAFLAYAVNAGLTTAFDASIREAVHAWSSPGLTDAMRGITLLGWDLVAIPLAGVAAWRFASMGRRRSAIRILIAVVGADVILNLVKLVFQRERPEALFGYVTSSTYSFPSGHAVLSLTLYGMVAVLVTGWPKDTLRAGAALLIFLVGFSRVYLGVHHPSDVLAGYALATAWLAVLACVRGWREVPK
jgi:undecaprenyl-diphosphatase